MNVLTKGTIKYPIDTLQFQPKKLLQLAETCLDLKVREIHLNFQEQIYFSRTHKQEQSLASKKVP